MRRLFFVTLLLLLLTACDNTGTPSSNVAPTDDLTINQIVETNAAASNPLRTPNINVTRTPLVLAPRATPTRACDEAPRSRLIVGERGWVSDNDPEPLNVRSGPGTGFTILGILRTGEVFDVLEGPRCGGDYVWYLVTNDDLQGWIAEGDFGSYYVEPYLPG